MVARCNLQQRTHCVGNPPVAPHHTPYIRLGNPQFDDCLPSGFFDGDAHLFSFFNQ